MSTSLKTWSLGCLCVLFAASCNNGSSNDCADQVQKLQQQITEKDQRISSLEDSLRMAMGANANTGAQTTDSMNNGGSSASASGNQSEESMYRKGATASNHRHGSVPGEFPEGSTRILTEKDVKFLSEWGLQVMQNEIYARHGMMFGGALGRHFSRESWYHGTSHDVMGSLTKTEKRNIEFLKNYKYNPETGA